MYKCDCCEAILEPHECKYIHDDERCELYVLCPYCEEECREYDSEEEEEYEESEDQENDD